LSTSILVVEDEPAIQELLRLNLEDAGFTVHTVADAESAQVQIRSALPDLILLDWMLPGQSGLAFARTLRGDARTRELPIIMVSARTDEADRISGLEAWVDDYVTKPFSPREIVARVRALARRGGMPAHSGPAVLRFDRLEVDEAAREARVDGRVVGLKPREFALLFALASNPGVAFSRSALVENVWGVDFEGDERTVDVHVRRLRAKLEDAAHLPRMLETVHGFGYKFARS
jgi:two-component system phosphate regulon response regulator PhoB